MDTNEEMVSQPVSRVATSTSGILDAGQQAVTDHQRAASRNMVFGALWCGGGIFVTMATYSAASSGGGGGRYFIAWGAILFGGIQFLKGLVNYFDEPPASVAPPLARTAAAAQLASPVTDDMIAGFTDQLGSVSVGKDGPLTPEARAVLLRAFKDGWRMTIGSGREKGAVILIKPGERTRTLYFVGDIVYFGKTQNYMT